MVFWHIDTRIDCYGPYCIPVPKAILAVGKNLSKRWLGTTGQGIIETWVGHSSTDSVCCFALQGSRTCGIGHMTANLSNHDVVQCLQKLVWYACEGANFYQVQCGCFFFYYYFFFILVAPVRTNWPCDHTVQRTRQAAASHLSLFFLSHFNSTKVENFTKQILKIYFCLFYMSDNN